ncbi:MAG: phosphate ABC transporter substrate-binding protein PstS, partial [Gemmatimonadetes bacterium]|nr:phosphate ABC transporter substrate-binding protein PstS [Gemmatimonadota bacterium]
MARWVRSAAAVLSVGMLLPACRGEGGKTPRAMAESESAGGKVALTGAGSTFDAPVFARWFHAYARAHPVQINYQSIGSGAGIRQFTEGTVDFGASDAPMTDEQLAKIPGAMNLPVILGSVAITYNLPALSQPLRLSGDVLADIFLGTIKKWNDPRLAALNPGVALPSTDILVVHRSDGSGTSYVFTDYLSSVSPAWRAGPGTGAAVAWPTGLG